MFDELTEDYRLARKASRIGAGVMYLLCAVLLVPLALYLYAWLFADLADRPPLAWWAQAVASCLLVVAAALLLGEFLRHFSDASSPFGGRQPARLVAASALLALKALLDATMPEFGPVDLALGPVQVSLAPHAGVDLKVIVMVVFLVCLAMVIRYGDALKRDSDSIL